MLGVLWDTARSCVPAGGVVIPELCERDVVADQEESTGASGGTTGLQRVFGRGLLHGKGHVAQVRLLSLSPL